MNDQGGSTHISVYPERFRSVKKADSFAGQMFKLWCSMSGFKVGEQGQGFVLNHRVLDMRTGEKYLPSYEDHDE